MIGDRRLEPVRWDASERRRGRIVLLVLANLALALWYFTWLLQPERIGNPVLYGVLVAAELFNLAQAAGFWWTVWHDRPRPDPPAAVLGGEPDVDVFIPTYGEPAEIVEPTVTAALRMRGARVRVHVLDDGRSPEIEEVAARYGVEYHTRPDRQGAKAGNINRALGRTAAPFVVVFDCDHVPEPHFLERTLPHMGDQRMAFVQTPQYYANGDEDGVASAAWAQQALFFGPIARGKDGLDAIFCCGTNVVFRRTALEDVGGLPEDSVTEDFELSVGLHERGWRSRYVPEVLARGLGPEDMAAYVGQQQRWARGCLSAIPRVLRARLPRRLGIQYLLSSMFFLSGWTFLVYMSLPVVRLLTGLQPVASAAADQFILHFVPYFGGAVAAVAAAGAGAYSFRAFAVMVANFWIHIFASLAALLRLPGRFVVTPKKGSGARQPGAVAPALLAVAVLVGTAVFGLLRDQDAGTLNNAAFAGLHIGVLLAGAWPALRGHDEAREAEGADLHEPALVGS